MSVGFPRLFPPVVIDCIFVCISCVFLYIYILLYICKFTFHHVVSRWLDPMQLDLHPKFVLYSSDRIYKVALTSVFTLLLEFVDFLKSLRGGLPDNVR